MEFLIEDRIRVALTTLYSQQPITIPPLQIGETIPVSVSRIRLIPAPLTPRLFDMLDSAGYTFRVGIGLGFIAPLAGSYFLRSGVDQTAGVLVNTKRYKIVTFNAGDNFTNVGAASNATGVGFTATGTTPTTWTHASILQEVTANLAFNANLATIQAALNATKWITDAGGVVLSQDGNIYLITWNNAGARTEIIGEGTNLAPLSNVDMGTLIEGDANLQEVQSMQISQQPATFVDLATALPDPTADVDVLQVGGGGLNHKVSITLNPSTFDGGFTALVAGVETALVNYGDDGSGLKTALENLSLNHGLLVTGRKYKITNFVAGDNFSNLGATNVTGNVFTASGTTPTTWTNGSTVSPVGAGNVSVTLLSSGEFLVIFQGDMANTDMGAITTDPSALQVPSGYSGFLPLDVAGVSLLLAGEENKTVTFSIRAIPPGGSSYVIFSTDITLKDTIFTPTMETPQPTDGAGLFRVSGATAAEALQGIVTSTLQVSNNVMALASIAGVGGLWLLKTGAAAGSDVAPLDYNALTNNKSWTNIL